MSAFERAVAEYLERTRALIGLESCEDLPPRHPAPFQAAASPVPAALMLDAETARRYALSIGDENPLFTDAAYARASCHGAQLAPGPVLVHVRYPADHGADRPGGYPVANFIAGVAWEFFDVVRVGTRFSSSKVLREVSEKRSGSGRRLIVLVSEVSYFDAAAHALGKAYGSLIEIPFPGVGTTRTVALERLGEDMLYEREPQRYEPAQVEAALGALDDERRRGATTLWWEDVAVGDRLTPIVQLPYTLHDAIAYQAIHMGLCGSAGGERIGRAFEPAFRAGRAGGGYPDHARAHPVTRWPYTAGDEHEDAHLAPFRGMPLPFDFGIQRAQVPQRLLSNWIGDEGFIRKLYVALRRPVFHGDAVWFSAVVTGVGEVRDPPGGDAVHGAASVRLEGVNQRGETVSTGYATVYLRSRRHGPVRLPIRPSAVAGHVPLAVHRAPDWYLPRAPAADLPAVDGGAMLASRPQEAGHGKARRR